MSDTERFEDLLTGGHLNSLGRTVEVVETVLADRSRLRELLDTYASADEVVRLRVSSALKRIAAVEHEWLVPHLDELIESVGQLDQASAQWTLAQLFLRYSDDLSSQQRSGALALMKRNLEHHTDWIVLNHTMETLAQWSLSDAELREWLRPQLDRLTNESRASVARRAVRLRAMLADV
jgi:hypothetical protein